jgi:hypothetical protein
MYVWFARFSLNQKIHAFDTNFELLTEDVNKHGMRKKGKTVVREWVYDNNYMIMQKMKDTRIGQKSTEFSPVRNNDEIAEILVKKVK